MSLGRRLALTLSLLAAGAAWVGVRGLEKVMQTWSAKDLRARAEMVAAGMSSMLSNVLADYGQERAGRLLDDLSRDERVLAGALCGRDLNLIAASRDFPGSLTCERLGANVHPGIDRGSGGWRPWHGVLALAGADVHVSAVPFATETMGGGFLVLVHDMAHLAGRAALAQRIFVLGCAAVAAIAVALSAFVARVSFRGWIREVRSLLRTPHASAKPSNHEFMPVAHDLRELIETLAAEGEPPAGSGTRWSAEGLREMLHRTLGGEKIIIVANREPYIHEQSTDGGTRVLHPASGLVTALEPVMRACSGVWIAHGSGSADRATADKRGRIEVPPGDEAYSLRRIWLSREEEQGYYYGFSNEGLWPLSHIAHTRPVFRADDFRQYREVNRRFADAVVEEAQGDDPIVLVQDYHFALAPRFIRERLPRATIITFWHIPWPNAERYGICPYGDELLEGLLGSSILGFHTQLHCNNFLDSVDRSLEVRIDREESAVVSIGRPTLVRPYPISIEWPSRWASAAPAIAECRASVIADLSLGSNALIGVGVDRIDYTKGIEERFLAVERLLEIRPDLRGRFTFVQLGAPSRTKLTRYHDLNADLERLSGRINERFGLGGYRPLVLLRRHHEPADVFRYCRAADLCYVSSLHDGMNLVAKEFVASRDDDGGVLVLSRFTGAARELPEALIVNPYDIEQAAAALDAALSMRPQEVRDRMRAMRSRVAQHNVYRWAGRMLRDAERLRRRDRLMARLDRTPLPVARAGI